MPVVSHPALALAKVQPSLTSAEIRRAIAPALPLPAPLRECKSNGSSSRTSHIVGAIMEDGLLKTAVCIRKLSKTASAGIVATLDPSSDAFTALPQGTIEPHNKECIPTNTTSEQVQLPSLIPVTRVSDVALARLRLSRQGHSQTPTVMDFRTSSPIGSRKCTSSTASSPQLQPLASSIPEPVPEDDRPHTLQFKAQEMVDHLTTPLASKRAGDDVVAPAPTSSTDHSPGKDTSEVPDVTPSEVVPATAAMIENEVKPAVSGLIGSSNPLPLTNKPARAVSRPSSSSELGLFIDGSAPQGKPRDTRPPTANSRASLTSALRKHKKPPVMYSVLTGHGWQKLALHEPPPVPTIDTVVQATSTRVLKEMIDPGPPGPSLPAMVPLPISKANRNKLEHRLSYPSVIRSTLGTSNSCQYYSREPTPATAVFGESLLGAIVLDPSRPNPQTHRSFHLHSVPTAPPPTLPSHWSSPLPPSQRVIEPPGNPYPMPPPAIAGVPAPAKRAQRVHELRHKQQTMIISQLACTSPHANNGITGKVKVVKFLGLPLVSG